MNASQYDPYAVKQLRPLLVAQYSDLEHKNPTVTYLDTELHFGHSESEDDGPECSQAKPLADRLDNTILVSGVLLSPLLSVATSTVVAGNPTLRVIGLLACLIDFSGLVTSAAFRLYLKTLKRSNKDEQFAKNLSGSWSDQCLATSSPITLIAAAMMLFLATLTGNLFTADDSQTVTNALGMTELVILSAGGVFSFAHCGLVWRSISKLGRHQEATTERIG